jgi:hypothetical protein
MSFDSAFLPWDRKQELIGRVKGEIETLSPSGTG